MRNAIYRYERLAFEPVHQLGRLHLIGPDVLWFDRCLVARGRHDPVAVGFQIGGAAREINGGHGPDLGRRRGIDDNRCPPFRYKANRGRAGHFANQPGPGAGRVHEDAAANHGIPRHGLPICTGMIQPFGPHTADHYTSPALDAAQITLMKRRHVDIHDTRLVSGGRHAPGPQ